ncbi:MAG: CBS domain-containing protein [Rhodospirillales bacterium]|nr:CBS domain-containing protein [Rhodospirillales bacterium]
MSGAPLPARPSRHHPRTAVFSKLARDFMRPGEEVLAVRPDTACEDMIGRLAATQATCAVVVDAAARPVGIITERDIALRIAYRVPGETPVERVMTSPAMSVRRRDYLYYAIALMRRHGLHHMPVVDAHGQLAGLLSLHDALAATDEQLMRQIDRLTHEGTSEGLRALRAAQVDLAEDLFADNLPAPEIQQLLSRINNDIYRRVGEATLNRMGAEGWGDIPVEACLIVTGSGGRGENFLSSDQDNGIIIADYPDDRHAQVDAFYRELAERLCRDLDAIGIPYCNGYCMAVNPLWRKSLSQWTQQIALWGKKSNFVAIRLADIFFDFQPVWGRQELAEELRRRVTGMVRNNHHFLRQMFQDKAGHNVALGFFGGFVTEREQREHRGRVNLKHTGTIPLVGAIRLLALREGVEATSTVHRISALTEQGVLSDGERADLTASFDLVTNVLLRHQIADLKAGKPVTYYVDPRRLAKAERTALLDALKAIDSLRKRVHLEFTGQIF